MATFLPFRALRPDPERAAVVASPPYDVVSRDEACQLTANNPYSFLHVTRPEVDLDPSVNTTSDTVYTRGRQTLERFIAEGILRRDTEERFYIYELLQDGHRQRGVVGLASVADYRSNLVRKHEHTRPDKEADRVRHMEILGAQSGTVFLCHRDDARIDDVAEAGSRGPAELDFQAEDGVRHRVWTIDDAEAKRSIEVGFRHVGPIYIADGHHRSAAAARVGSRAGSAGFLAVSFPTSHLKILAYHRVVRDRRGLSVAELRNRLATLGGLSTGYGQSARGQFGVFFGGQWHTLKLAVPSSCTQVEALDVSLLQRCVMAPILGIENPRSDERIAFVGGSGGLKALEITAGSEGVAFALHPTALDDLLTIADQGVVMPPKSTWFDPKLRDGLFTHLLE